MDTLQRNHRFAQSGCNSSTDTPFFIISYAIQAQTPATREVTFRKLYIIQLPTFKLTLSFLLYQALMKL